LNREYPHGTVPETAATGCGSITGGAFVPAGAWTGYDGSYLYADFNCGAIVRLSFVGGPAASVDFATGLGASRGDPDDPGAGARVGL